MLVLGFDDMFMRLWHFYLADSQAGFASRFNITPFDPAEVSDLA